MTVRLKTTSDIKRYAQRLINEVREKKISQTEAKTITPLLNIMLKAIDIDYRQELELRRLDHNIVIDNTKLQMEQIKVFGIPEDELPDDGYESAKKLNKDELRNEIEKLISENEKEGI